MSEEVSKAEQYHNEEGKFKEGNPGGGRPPMSEQERLIKKAVRQLIKEYKEELAQVLPEIKPVIIEMALNKDLGAIKEIHDRVMGKSEQKTDITTKGKPLYLPPELLNKNDLSSSGSEPDSE